MQEKKCLFICAISGRPIVKKNTQKVVRFKNGFTKKIDSPQYQKWKTNALFWIYQARRDHINDAHQFKQIDTPIQASFRFYFNNHQAEADLSNLLEGPADLLKESGIIKDDSLIHSFDGSRKVFGKGEGLIIELYEYIAEHEEQSFLDN
jgi:Holliday junction resolvase RusA-like endonuclease